MKLPEHLRTGLRGEQLAARYLAGKNYRILAANFRSPGGETDLIAKAPDKAGTICFTEVKTRNENAVLPPSEAVDADKRKRLENSAAAYFRYARLNGVPYRFDIIEVILHDLNHAEINHIENAF